MKLRLVPLFFLLCFYSFSQQKKIDSLEALLRSTSVQDSVRLAQLNELVYLYYGIDPEIGIEKADEAILLAGKLDDDNGRATALAYKGIIIVPWEGIPWL